MVLMLDKITTLKHMSTSYVSVCHIFAPRMKSFIAKWVICILVNLRLCKIQENNKTICNTFDHNFKLYFNN